MKKKSLLIVIAIAFTFAFSGCYRPFSCCIEGEGSPVTQTLDLSSFNSIQSNGSFDVVIEQGDTQKVVVVGNQNIIDRLKTYVHNNNWEIELQRGNYCDYELTIYITVPTLKVAQINGSGSIQISNFYNQPNTELNINGSGSIKTDTLQAEDINFSINGSGNIKSIVDCASLVSEINASGDIKTSGWADDQTINIDGSGSYQGSNCLSQNVDINILGSGDAYVSVEKILNIKINGSGSVYYVGHPQMNVNINGSGKVVSQN